MTMTEAEQLAALDLLRAPFAANQINQLPKQMKRDDKERAACKPGTFASADGKYCGGYHARSMHLDYVGHAALTDRLLSVDPEWTWRPLALQDNGLPAFDRDGGLWIELTIAGVTRLGYGDSQGKTGGNAVKEAIGDALRNAGMRFGAALDLWHKGDLHDAAEARGEVPTAPASPARDWVGEASKLTEREPLLALWQEARASGAQTPVLDAISARGNELFPKE